MARDDFSDDTKRKLGDRVNQLCSNPACGAGTKGPHTSPSKASSVGKACHIHAAAPGGPRYDLSQTTDERSSIDNAIWLCAICADKIDADPDRYSAHTLREWKLDAELKAHRAQGKPAVPRADPSTVDRLAAILIGTEARLVYALEGSGHVFDKFVIRVEGVDRVANVFRFTSLSGGSAHGKVDSMPLGDAEDAWDDNGTWRIRTSGYLEHTPLAGHRYKSRPRRIPK